jgi:hypothetical protein
MPKLRENIYKSKNHPIRVWAAEYFSRVTGWPPLLHSSIANGENYIRSELPEMKWVYKFLRKYAEENTIN